MERRCQATQTGEDVHGSNGSLPGKYVAVVYHRIGYQEGASAEYVDLDETSGTCTLVKDDVDSVKKRLLDVPDYLVIAVVSIVLFIPFGIAAVSKSIKVRKACALSDLETATLSSAWALQYALFAIFTGPLIVSLVFLCVYIPLLHV